MTFHKRSRFFLFNLHINSYQLSFWPFKVILLFWNIFILEFPPLFIYRAYYRFKITSLILIGVCTFSPTLFIALSFIIMYSLLPHLFPRNILSFFSLFYPSKHVTSFSVLMNSKSKFILWRSCFPLYIIIYLLFLILVSITHWNITTFSLTFT
jgi:hypothetical protein